MKHIKFSICLLLSFSIFTARAMDFDDTEDQKFYPQPEISSGIIVHFGILGSSQNLETLLANLHVLQQNQRLFDAAENCDISQLQNLANEDNANSVSSENLSLLTLSLKKQAAEPTFNNTAPEYLISKGALIDKRAKRTEKICPLAFSTALAVLSGKFDCLEYLLSKNGNPFLIDQTSLGASAAFQAVMLKGAPLSDVQNAHRARTLALLCSRATNLHEALETYDVPTITKFLNRETVNAQDSTGHTPLLRIASKGSMALQDETKEIVQLLLSHQALPNQIGCTFGHKSTPLQGITTAAIELSDTRLIPLMLEAGADPELDPTPETQASPYSIAFTHKHAPSECICNRAECVVQIQTINRRESATKVLALFDAHVASKLAALSISK